MVSIISCLSLLTFGGGFYRILLYCDDGLMLIKREIGIGFCSGLGRIFLGFCSRFSGLLGGLGGSCLGCIPCMLGPRLSISVLRPCCLKTNLC